MKLVKVPNVLDRSRGNPRRAEDFTAEEVTTLNNCARYLSVSVYRDRHDCTLGGVTSTLDTLYVPHPHGPHTLGSLLEHGHAGAILEMLPPAFPGCTVRFKPRGETRWCMSGGNFVGCCDSRFSELYRYPCSVHDRIESK